MGDLTLNFSRKEFQCPCCDYENISEELVAKLQAVRSVWGKRIRITSGTRCPTHNHGVNGSSTSSHMAQGQDPSWAADFEVIGGSEFYSILPHLLTEFPRIGLYPNNNFIHVDVDPNKSQGVMWFG